MIVSDPCVTVLAKHEAKIVICVLGRKFKDQSESVPFKLRNSTLWALITDPGVAFAPFQKKKKKEKGSLEKAPGLISELREEKRSTSPKYLDHC